MMDKILLGQTESHLTEFTPSKRLLHKEVIGPLTLLKKAAEDHGFDLQVISGFRSFDRQLQIWNAKATGQKKILDDKNNEVDITRLSNTEIMHAILRFSALPGASRHHWGTDFDVFDAKMLSAGEIQLNDDETTGPMRAFHEWLDERIATQNAFGFYRPYDQDRGGIAREKWHLSYKPLSEEFLRQFHKSILEQAITDSTIELKATILSNLEEIYKRYVLNILR